MKKLNSSGFILTKLLHLRGRNWLFARPLEKEFKALRTQHCCLSERQGEVPIAPERAKGGMGEEGEAGMALSHHPWKRSVTSCLGTSANGWRDRAFRWSHKDKIRGRSNPELQRKRVLLESVLITHRPDFQWKWHLRLLWEARPSWVWTAERYLDGLSHLDPVVVTVR